MSPNVTKPQVEGPSQERICDPSEELDIWAFSGSPTPYSFSHWDAEDLKALLKQQRNAPKEMDINSCIMRGKLIDSDSEEENARKIKIVQKVPKPCDSKSLKFAVRSKRAFRATNVVKNKCVISVTRSKTQKSLNIVEKKRRLLNRFVEATDSTPAKCRSE